MPTLLSTSNSVRDVQLTTPGFQKTVLSERIDAHSWSHSALLGLELQTTPEALMFSLS